MSLLASQSARFLVVMALAFSSVASGANSPLDDWSSWLSKRHTQIDCPWQMAKPAARACIWPGRLDMDLHPLGLKFSYSVEVFKDNAIVALPGSSRHWPRSVTTAGKQAPLLNKNEIPHIQLNTGKHEIEGEFRWKRRPGAIAVPDSIALVVVKEAGNVITPDRRSGRLVLSQTKERAKTQSRDSISVEVFRKISDGVPIIMDTQMVLSVSGSPREVRLGQLSWNDTEIAHFNSPLPARIEDNGDIRIQVVPGKHTVTLRSLLKTSPELALSPIRATEHWPEFEYMSFQADTNVRQAKVTGAPSIDTSQTPIPAIWRELPTYRLDTAVTLEIATQYRGDHAPAENQLQVTRDLWLDFDGQALTGLESVTGAMHRDWRIDASHDTAIGRAKVSNRPVLVTQHQGAEGVEIRSQSIDLSAITRVASPSVFSATGWNEKVASFNGVLHTPPGWRVFYASGVDEISGTWISLWDLWDIFLLLVIVAATKKLLGFKTALVATVTMVICFHEQGIPIGGYPVLLALLALLSIASGRLKSVTTMLSFAACGLFVLALVGYSVATFRLAIYPSLERASVGEYKQSRHQVRAPREAAFTQDLAASDSIQKQDRVMSSMAKMASPLASGQLAEAMKPSVSTKYDAYNLGENDKVQTGPGTPAWAWKSIRLHSSAPLPPEAEIRVSYSPPIITSLWRVLSVVLACVYGGLLITAILKKVKPSLPPSAANESQPPSTAVATAALVLTVLMTTPMDGIAAEYPPKYLLDELERRLVEPPECLPHCASLDNGVISVTEQELAISFHAYAATDIVLLLPSPREGWQVAEIQLDGSKEITARRQQNHLAILLTQGHHQVTVRGPLQGESASVSIPIPIHNIAYTGDRWLVSGIVDGRIPSNTLSLRAKNRVEKNTADTLSPASAKPFFMVHREFHLGTQWQMTTVVTRVAPEVGPTSLTLPLLSFERPLSGEIQYKDGNALLQFSSQQSRIVWESALTPVATLELIAASNEFYLETWRLAPSALWRASYTGIPAVKEASGASSLQPQWRPWPGEKLNIAFHRPEGIEGPTHTVEKARLVYQAGAAISQSTLSLEILASVGQDYTITLPEDANVVGLLRDGVSLNLPEGNDIVVGLQPGRQRLVIGFEQTGHDGWISATPNVTLPGGASNITIDYQLARDRWPLYLSGPAIGPAMVFWGVFCVIVIGALILSVLASKLGLVMPIGLPGWLLLGIGLSTINSYGVLIVAVLFFSLAYRGAAETTPMTRLRFNSWQVSLVMLSLIVAICLASAIPMGLLSTPNMIVTGNNSWSHFYSFFQDRAAADSFPEATVISVNLIAYRVVMLAWSLWLANRLMIWAAWGWKSYSHTELWRAKAEP